MRLISAWKWLHIENNELGFEVESGPIRFVEERIDGFRTWRYSFISCGFGIDFSSSKYYNTYSIRLIGFIIEFTTKRRKLRLV